MTTAMRCMLIVITVLSGAASLQWSTDPADGVTVYVCEGRDLTLPWNITADSGEQIVDITWLFSGHSGQTVAMLSHNSFFPSSSYSQRVQQVSNAGIILSEVTQGDAGNYTIEVNVRDANGSLVTYTHSATVRVASVSVAHSDASMTVRQEPVAVYDQQAGQYRIQLSCYSQGFQPPAVIWTMPSGQSLRSSTQDGGVFSLLLANPVSGGNYNCRVPSDAPAATCLQGNDSALEGATVYVNEVTSRLALLETGHTALKSKNSKLKADNGHLKTQLSTLRENLTDLHSDNDVLKQRLQTLKVPGAPVGHAESMAHRSSWHSTGKYYCHPETASHQVSFHVTSLSSYSRSNGQVVIPNSVITNQGSAYNPSNGYFTAPYNGTYVFLVTVGPYSTNYYAYLDLVVDGTMLCQIRTYWASNYGSNEMGTCHAPVHLRVGQRVWLNSRYNTAYFQTDLTSFSGYLVSADDPQ